MDAKLVKYGVILGIAFVAQIAEAATVSTTNFVVTAPSEDIARRVGKCAEFWREELATLWLKQPLPNWYKPCPISVKVGQIGAGGSTTFTFENGEVFGWRMEVQGTLERILDSVIPHEVNHTIFASYFRRPLPRWADEGAATLVEHESERMRQTRLLDQVIKTSRRIPLNELLAMREYPKDMHQVLTLYAEGYSLADYLVQQKGNAGRSIYLKFLEDAHQQGWEQAIQQHYGYNSVAHLEKQWHGWIMAGSPSINLPEGTQLADVGNTGERGTYTPSKPAVTDPNMQSVPNIQVRGQSPRSQAPAPNGLVKTAGEPTTASSPSPLAMIPRRLRVNVNTGPYRREVSGAEATQLRRITQQSEHPSSHIIRGEEDFRPRSEDQSISGPSLRPELLPRSEDGTFCTPEGCFEFPNRLSVVR